MQIYFTGQTWTLTIIRLMILAKDLEEGKEVDTRDLIFRIPYIEAEVSDGTLAVDIFNGLESPRYMKTHLPYVLWKQQLEKHPNIKVIQTMRNPKDTLVSAYHHCRCDGQMGAFHGTWDQYFEMFKENKLAYGDYFEHTANWYKFNKDRKESLILVYEDMKKTHRDHVIKIAKFLGYDLSDKVTDIIVKRTTFKDMSKTVKDYPGWKSERSSFIRKGEVGDWVNYFSEEQSKYIDAKCEKYFEPLGLKFEYGNVDRSK